MPRPSASDETVLVTGGAGFLGSNLCRGLLSGGKRVLCLDNLSTGYRSNVDELRANPRFEFIEADVRDPLSIGRVDRLTEIYNLACPASPPLYQDDPIGTLLTSIEGAHHVLELAIESGARVLQASSSEVYGDPTEGHEIQTEEYRGNVSTTGPRACYDEGKRAAEALFYDYQRVAARKGRPISIRVARIFNTYGPLMHPGDGRVVSNFIVRALGGEPLRVHGDRRITRSFCYVDDTVEGLIRLMRAGIHAGVAPVNLGNPEDRTIGDLADLVIRLTGSTSEIVDVKEAEDDPKMRKPSIDRAKEWLDGWTPEVSLEDGINRTIEYFRSIAGATKLEP